MPLIAHTRTALTESDFHGLDKTFRRLRPGPAVRCHYRLVTGTAFPNWDRAKLWDVRNVLDIARTLRKDCKILDCGAYNSAPLFALASAGFRHIHGIDLNGHINAMPMRRRVTYTVQDMQSTAYTDGAFDFVTSSSTIEHGVSWEAFLAEARRLLRPGGLLYVSTDIVADGTDTSTASAFGLPWSPLRPSDLAITETLFTRHGFANPGANRVHLPDPLPVRFLGQQLGFIAFVTTAA